MRRSFVWLIVVGGCWGQAFEVASVKLVDPAARAQFGTTGGPGTSDPGRIHFGHATMIELVMKAYGLPMDRVVDGPKWARDFMGSTFYMVDATMPPTTTKEQFETMLQGLLAKRFHLEAHRETRGYPGYELTVGKDGPKLKEVAPTPKEQIPNGPRMPVRDKDGSLTLGPGPGTLSTGGPGVRRLRYQERSMEEFTKQLGQMVVEALGTDFTADFGAPKAQVTDKTGLTGVYNFSMEYACLGCRGLSGLGNLPVVAAARARAEATGSVSDAASDPMGDGLPTIFKAVEKLGLKLVKVKDVPVEVLVIDKVEKAPVGN